MVWGQKGISACGVGVYADSLIYMSEHLKSERLIFREWQDSDRDAFARMNADPIVMQYLPRSLDEKSSNKLVDRFQKHFDEHGFGLYAVEIKESGEFAGFIGLQTVDFKAAFTPAVEIAWRLDYGVWGHGYASEGAQAVLDHGLKKLKIKKIVAFTVPENARSIHLMEKIGLKHVKGGDFQHPAVRKTDPLSKHVLYSTDGK